MRGRHGKQRRVIFIYMKAASCRSMRRRRARRRGLILTKAIRPIRCRTGSDSDWIVKLIDVYPQKYLQDWKLSGYELMIADEIFRGRFRKSFERPEAITPNEVTPYTIDLHTADHVFKRGHRIMVQVQSTWF